MRREEKKRNCLEKKKRKENESAVWTEQRTYASASMLHYAAWGGHQKLLDSLMNGKRAHVDVMNPDFRGATVLHFAALGGRLAG